MLIRNLSHKAYFGDSVTLKVLFSKINIVTESLKSVLSDGTKEAM